jgi:pimeloyl-ACP methyl ester carboxylesterase
MGGYATSYWRKAMIEAGLGASAFNYRSLSASLNENADLLAHKISGLSHAPVIHLAGHSLGGLVILRCLERHSFHNLGRVALVGSPVQGSAAARNLSRSTWGKMALGRSITDWQGPNLSKLPAHVQFGSIAGVRPAGLGSLAARFKGPHDGTVALSETRLDPESDRLLAPASHTQMLFSPFVAAQIIHFLCQGRFAEPSA